MKDFIHKSLLSAGSKDAVSNMLQGSAVGAVANVGLGAVQGDFDVLGNATSGALLGAGGGAAARHFGSKYTSGLSNMGSEAPSSFKNSIFTHAKKEDYNFWENSPEMAGKSKSFLDNLPKGGSTNKAAESSSAPSTANKFENKKGYDVVGNDVFKNTGKTTDVQIPQFNTFDAFGNKTSTSATLPMDMQRKISPTEQNVALRADEIRQEKKAELAKNPVKLSNKIDSKYKPSSLSNILPERVKEHGANKRQDSIASSLIDGIFKETGRGPIKASNIS